MQPAELTNRYTISEGEDSEQKHREWQRIVGRTKTEDIVNI